MSINSTATSRGLVIACLVMLGIGIGVLTSKIPANVGKLPGGFLVVIGLLQILQYRRTGRQVYSEGRSMSPHIVAAFWNHIGEQGAQWLFFGLGCILVCGGGIVLIRAVSR